VAISQSRLAAMLCSERVQAMRRAAAFSLLITSFSHPPSPALRIAVCRGGGFSFVARTGRPREFQ